jgi:sugar porter (SP) family MFS transporter
MAQSTTTHTTGESWLQRKLPFVAGAAESGNRLVLGIALVAALGGFLFGYDTGIIGGALLYIKKDMALGSGEQQAVVSSLLVGACIGALGAGYLADRISRRYTSIIAGCIYVIGALGAAFSQTFWEIVAARFVLGLAVGTASFVAPMYIAELVPSRMRGGTVTFNQIMITGGILLAYIAAWGLSPVSNNWRWMVGIAAAPGALLAVGMLFMPHTPRWLVEHGREDDARRVLKRIRGTDDVDEEVGDIKRVSQEEGSVRDLLKRAVRPMLIVGVGLAIFQQIVGINTVIYYSPTILSFTGLNAHSAITQALFIGVTNFAFTIVAALLLDTLGRRFFLIFGTVCLTIALVVLGLYFHIPSLQRDFPDLALAAMMFYIMGFAIGLGPVFWLMIAEIYPLRIRGPAMAVATFFNWGFNFAVSYTFLTLIDTVTTGGAFWFYAFLGVLALGFFWFKVPETKDRSLEQIERDISGDAEVSRRPGGRWHGAPPGATA